MELNHNQLILLKDLQEFTNKYKVDNNSLIDWLL